MPSCCSITSFSTATITYALDLLSQEILNIKLGPFKLDSGAVSLEEQLWPPTVIFARINVSHTLVDLEYSYLYSTFVVVWRAWVICQSALSHMILAACLFGTIGISFCPLSLFTDYHKSVCIPGGCLPNQSWTICYSHPDRCRRITGF